MRKGGMMNAWMSIQMWRTKTDDSYFYYCIL